MQILSSRRFRAAQRAMTMLFALALLILVAPMNGCTKSSVPTSPSGAITSDDPGLIEASLTRVNPFMRIEGKAVTFDHVAAAAAGLSNEDLVIGSEIASLATAAINGREVTERRLAPFIPFFRVVAARAAEPESEDRETSLTRPAIPMGADATLTHCPTEYWFSTVNARSYLLSRGYHLVPSYATGLYGRDYSRYLTTSHWPGSFNPTWCYRSQAIVSLNNHEIRFQEPEPNPELQNYLWGAYPGLWWGPYVRWWHLSYC